MPSRIPTCHVFIAASIDGYIARANGDIDWLTRYATGGEDTGYDAFMESIDGLMMGRNTFEKVLTFGQWPFSKPVVVLSRSMGAADLPHELKGKVRVSAAAPTDLLASLADEGWSRVYVDGGKVIQSFLRDNLIADMVLTHVPVVLGGGIPLFGNANEDIGLTLVETRGLASGLVQSKYLVGTRRAGC